MLQIVVYSVLARQARKSVILLWLGLLGVVGLGSLAETFAELLKVVLSVDAGVLIILVMISLWRLRPISPAPNAEQDDDAGALSDSVGGGVPAAPRAHGDVEGNGQRSG